RTLRNLEKVVPEVDVAFSWSLANDPDLAVRIVGNGHRLFSRCAGLRAWPTMIDRALATRAHHGLEYGRALCGVALAHWLDAPEHGRKAASAALALFREISGSEWDRANALRHVGLC